MSASETYTPRGFYRSSDGAVLGGVCAGVAEHFGINLKVLRVLAVVAFFCAMPMAIIAYLAVVFLVPARDSGHYASTREHKQSRRERRKARKQARRDAEHRAATAPSAAAAAVRGRCQVLDERLARLEKYVTSSRYRLDQEFRNL